MDTKDREFIVEKIRTQYTEKTDSTLDEIKKLDKKVKKPANIFAYVFGSFAAIVLGCGMSLIMTDINTYLNISEPLVPGIIIGVIGLFFAIINYPVYKRILTSRRKKYAAKIIELSDKITKEDK
ncbi:MAG: dihydropteridine reductase [Clostridia bacterium]|nr:dihydropteridine reductase [Clostridia bacterium]